ncbi:hypothetical protein FF38_13654 [Lucilia cuprina]|uniref:Uncharacterized protein n=1 Tax=Lucilia cuprina TaxID=7375 RepID=A0A0L0BNB2_LUCCU|nr:hypothetical protein FF38_13654 [Lucilia cuprina]
MEAFEVIMDTYHKGLKSRSFHMTYCNIFRSFHEVERSTEASVTIINQTNFKGFISETSNELVECLDKVRCSPLNVPFIVEFMRLVKLNGNVYVIYDNSHVPREPDKLVLRVTSCPQNFFIADRLVAAPSSTMVKTQMRGCNGSDISKLPTRYVFMTTLVMSSSMKLSSVAASRSSSSLKHQQQTFNNSYMQQQHQHQ